MGLAAKRMVNLLSEVIAGVEQQMLDVSGKKIAVEVDFDSFSDSALQWVESTGLLMASEAIKVICRDEIGKEAISKSIKHIVLKHTDNADKKDIALKGGVLTITSAFESSDGRVREHELVQFLENNL